MKNATLSQKRNGFRIHAIAFVPGVAALVLINLLVGPPYWAQWPLLGWAVGLLCHWFFVLGPGARRTPVT